VKTTVNIDEETLKEFKNMATSRYGGSRKLSQAIEDSMKNYNTTSVLIEYSKRAKILIESIPSSREIIDRRPAVDWSAGSELRAMRDERAAGLSRQ
jgi:hypothetical protein